MCEPGIQFTDSAMCAGINGKDQTSLAASVCTYITAAK